MMRSCILFVLASALMGSGLDKQKFWEEHIRFTGRNTVRAEFRSPNSYLQAAFYFETLNPNVWMDRRKMDWHRVEDASVVAFIEEFFVSGSTAESGEIKPSPIKRYIGPFEYFFSEIRFQKVLNGQVVFKTVVEICEIAIKIEKIHFHSDKFTAAEKFFVNL